MIERIIYFPFSGGSRYSYSAYKKLLEKTVSNIIIELPGRGQRTGEDPITDHETLVNDLYKQVKPFLDSKYIFYGHSMGALLSYLVLRKLIDEQENLPLFLTITGCKAPSRIGINNKNIHQLPSKEFWEVIKGYGGLPEDVYNDPHLRQMIEGNLRQDIMFMETYRYKDWHLITTVPILVINGDQESLEPDDIFNWKAETNGMFKDLRMNGNHFFINGNELKIVREMFSFYNLINESVYMPEVFRNEML